MYKERLLSITTFFKNQSPWRGYQHWYKCNIFKIIMNILTCLMNKMCVIICLIQVHRLEQGVVVQIMHRISHRKIYQMVATKTCKAKAKPWSRQFSSIASISNSLHSRNIVKQRMIKWRFYDKIYLMKLKFFHLKHWIF